MRIVHIITRLIIGGAQENISANMGIGNSCVLEAHLGGGIGYGFSWSDLEVLGRIYGYVDGSLSLNDPSVNPVVDVLSQRFEILPVVTLQPDRTGTASATQSKQLIDGCPGTQDRSVEQHHRMCEVFGHWQPAGAVGKQPVLPMRYAIPATGEAVADEQAKLILSNHRVDRFDGTPCSPDHSNSANCSATRSAGRSDSVIHQSDTMFNRPTIA